jgi:GrpB-like predicted nucleotidyltransferase (UPF0157 family)
VAELGNDLRMRLQSAGVDVFSLFGPGIGPWEAWLRLHDHYGRRATLADLYELEAARQGVRPEELTEADRLRLRLMTRPFRRGSLAVVPGSDRSGDPHEVISYDPGWAGLFTAWRDRLTAVLGKQPVRIEHVGSTAVPGLAAKPIIDTQVSVPDLDDEESYLTALESAGLVLRLRESGHRFLWPPQSTTRDAHIHVCGIGGSWERDHLLFRDYLRSHPEVRARYAMLKQDLISRWRHDRSAYGAAKTAFVLDTLESANLWAQFTGWQTT